MVAPAVVMIVAGLGIVLLAVFMWTERLPRNAIAGVRTAATMRSDEAFRVANKVAAPLTAVGGAILAAGGLAAAIISGHAGRMTLYVTVAVGVIVVIAGAVKGIRASKSV